ncbi:A10/OS-D family protein [Kitasatospora sp. MBT66]|uniref:A10/OS-D family protein n=1 Tax=Kitasatospora sp. MBT66 TaxID=1444769 RepID=UPI0009EB9EBE|nr:A10/OS-D family protein [Kitasatospora sp. MBT66]
MQPRNALLVLVTAGLLTAGPVSTAIAEPEHEKYLTRFDNIDVDRILKSDRLFTNYFNCLMDRGKCTPDGKELKSLLPDALRVNCAHCTNRQKKGTDRILRFIVKNRPTEWKQLEEKYDPDDIYVARYNSHAAASDGQPPRRA